MIVFNLPVRNASIQEITDSLMSPDSLDDIGGGEISSGTIKRGGVGDLLSEIEKINAGAMQGIPSRSGPKVQGTWRQNIASKVNNPEAAAGGTLKQMRAEMMKNKNPRAGNTKNGGTVNALTMNETVNKVSSFEVVINECVARTVMSALADFSADRYEFLFSQPKVMPKSLLAANAPAKLISIFSVLLSSNEPDDVLIASYPLLVLIVSKFAGSWFGFVHSLASQTPTAEALGVATLLVTKLELLVRGLLKHASYNVTKMRIYSAEILYLLLKANFMASGDLTVSQNIITTAISHVLDDYLLPIYKSNLQSSSGHLPQSIALLESLAAITNISDSDSKAVCRSKEYLNSIKVVVEKSCIIVKQTLEIARQEHFGKASDPTQYEDLLLEMADVNAHLPEVRINWLRKLATHHQTVDGAEGLHNHAEAGQCLVEMARLMKLQATSASYTDKLMRPVETKSITAGVATPRHVLTLLEACKVFNCVSFFVSLGIRQCAAI